MFGAGFTVTSAGSLNAPLGLTVARNGDILTVNSGDGFITTSGKAPALYRETLLPNLTAGLQAASRPDTLDKRIEMKVSYDTEQGAKGPAAANVRVL